MTTLSYNIPMTKPWLERDWGIKAAWVRDELDPKLAELIPGYLEFFRLATYERSEISREVVATPHGAPSLSESDLYQFTNFLNAIIAQFPGTPSPLWTVPTSKITYLGLSPKVGSISNQLHANKKYNWINPKTKS